MFEDRKLEWETGLPPGFSSPVVWDDKIFLTGPIAGQQGPFLSMCRNVGAIEPYEK